MFRSCNKTPKDPTNLWHSALPALIPWPAWEETVCAWGQSVGSQSCHKPAGEGQEPLCHQHRDPCMSPGGDSARLLQDTPRLLHLPSLHPHSTGKEEKPAEAWALCSRGLFFAFWVLLAFLSQNHLGKRGCCTPVPQINPSEVSVVVVPAGRTGSQ